MYAVILLVMRHETASSKKVHKSQLNKIRNSVFKNISFLLFFFTVSWMPNYVVQMIKVKQLDHNINLLVEDVVVIMFYSNVIVDPLIYGLGSQDFRERVMILVSDHIQKTRNKLSRKMST